jgi:hypothetical protein
MTRPVRMRSTNDARPTNGETRSGSDARRRYPRSRAELMASDAPPVRGVAKPPDASISTAPIVGPVFRPIEPAQNRPTKDWALFALIVGYPIWRLLGANLFIVPLLAVPMALELYRRRRIKFPSGFTFYALLILIALLSISMINKTPPGAIPPAPGVGRYLAWLVRVLDFVAGGVVLLYVGNLTERELPTQRVVKMLASLFVSFIVGGLLGMVLPAIKVMTPVGHLLPHSLRSNSFVSNLVTLQFAQYQAVLGNVAPRPDFPLNYTNTWGECVALLLPWFLIAMLRGKKSLGRRAITVAVLLVALIPIIYSLNRGMWIGVGIGLAYVLFRLAMTGRTIQVAVVLSALAMAAIVLLTTPLSSVVSGRVDHPRSNDGRSNINSAAIDAAASSPLIGYGGMTGVIGSQRSLAIGPTAECPQCGNLTIGGDGQMWQLLITEGFAGAALYVLFFVRFAWKYRRDTSPIGTVGVMTVLVVLWFMTVYTALELPLMIIMVALGLWWRHARGRVAA